MGEPNVAKTISINRTLVRLNVSRDLATQDEGHGRPPTRAQHASPSQCFDNDVSDKAPKKPSVSPLSEISNPSSSASTRNKRSMKSSESTPSIADKTSRSPSLFSVLRFWNASSKDIAFLETCLRAIRSDPMLSAKNLATSESGGCANRRLVYKVVATRLLSFQCPSIVGAEPELTPFPLDVFTIVNSDLFNSRNSCSCAVDKSLLGLSSTPSRFEFKICRGSIPIGRRHAANLAYNALTSIAASGLSETIRARRLARATGRSKLQSRIICWFTIDALSTSAEPIIRS
mmetsp:Transcript_7203/g.10725  ORF Transcript_7203/g.10725 Transcript_7203/m.10725 type:complete len:288 (-) Transcript_7203:534-1397(-)